MVLAVEEIILQWGSGNSYEADGRMILCSYPGRDKSVGKSVRRGSRGFT
jgi:hypothetical protein